MSMQPLPGSGRGTRLTLFAIALLILLALVAFASRTGFTHHGPQAAPSQRYTSYALTLFVIFFVLMIPVAVYAYSIRLRERAVAKNRKSFQARVLGYGLRLFVIFGVGFLLFRFRRSHHLFFFQHFHPFGLGVVNKKTGHGRPHAQYNPTFQWTVLWITLVVLAVAGAYLYYKWKTRIPPFVPRDVTSVADDFAASIDDAIDDLESEPDARRAVIAAYARMEAALGRNGLHRAASETALEYLRRVLLGLTARGEPVQRLTGLFEQAKFSDHRIDESMKLDAIGALREIRADLQAAPA